MSSVRHPFAYTQYVRYSRSTDTFASWLRMTPESTDIPPVPPLNTIKQPAPQAIRRSQSQPPVPRLNLDNIRREALPPADVESSVTSRSSPGHFVKHSSRVTLLLSGQDEGVCEPTYTNGATIEGILAVPRPEGLLSLQIKVSIPCSSVASLRQC